MPKSNTIIDDGFGKPYRAPSGNTTGDSIPANGSAEPERRVTPDDGFTFISPVDFERTAAEPRSERIERPTAIDPGTGSGNPDNIDAPRRRGRPVGSTNRQKPSPVSSLKDALMMGNVFLMSLLSADEDWAADELEAKRIADATEKLASFYTSAVDPKKMAWAEFLLAVGAYAGPRVLNQRAKSKRGKFTPDKPRPTLVPPLPKQDAAQPLQPAPPKPGLKPLNEMTPSEIFGFEPPSMIVSES